MSHHHHHQSAGFCNTMDYPSVPTTLTPLLAQVPPTHANSAGSPSMISSGTNSSTPGSYVPKTPTVEQDTQLMAISAPSTGTNPNTSWAYNSFQYPSCATAGGPNSQYSATPTMVLYPQLYSTVNQNQIHLHLHATTNSEKLEQYFGAVESGPGPSKGVEVGIRTSDSHNRDQQQGFDVDGGFQDLPANGNKLSERLSEPKRRPTQDESKEVICNESVWRPY